MKNKKLTKNKLISLLRLYSSRSYPSTDYENHLHQNLHKILDTKFLNMDRMEIHDQMQKKNFFFPYMAIAASLATVAIVTFIAWSALNISTLTTNTPSPEVTELRNLADVKFKKLNNNASLNSIDAILAQNGGDTNISEDQAKQIIDLSQNQKEEFYYSEQELKIENPQYNYLLALYFGSADITNTLIDYTKPVTIKNWYSLNYSKFTIEQDNKLLIMNINTPDYNLEYLGGEYALKENLSSPRYLGGYTNSSKNQDLEFIKAILNSPDQFKKTGNTTINGVNLDIYERNYESDIVYPDPSGTYGPTKHVKNLDKYFLDPKTLQIQRAEYYIDNNLAKSTNSISNKSISDYNDITDIINSNELNSTPIKSKDIDLSLHVGIPKDFYGNLTTLSTKYNLYYSDKSDDLIMNPQDFDAERNNKDTGYENSYLFNPSLNIYSGSNDMLLNYFQGNINYSIFRSTPALNNTLQRLTDKDITIKIDGNDVKAKFTSLQINDSRAKDTDWKDDLHGRYLINLIFQNSNDKYWNLITIRTNNKDLNDFNFISLTSSKASDMQKDIDKKLSDQNQALVNDFYDNFISLNPKDVPQPLRIISDDINKTQMFDLVSIEKSSVKSYESKCGFDISVLPMECAAEKFNGYLYKFQNTNDAWNKFKVSRLFQYLITYESEDKVKQFLKTIPKEYTQSKYGEKNPIFVTKTVGDTTILLNTNLDLNQNDLDNFLNSFKKVDDLSSYSNKLGFSDNLSRSLRLIKSLDEIPTDLRLLPGDLSKTTNSNLIVGVKYYGKNYQSMCDNTTLSIDMNICLLIKFNGYDLYFGNLNYYILNGSKSDIQKYIEDHIKNQKAYSSDPNNQYKLGEFNGKIVMLKSADPKVISKFDEIISKISLNNSFDILKQQLKPDGSEVSFTY